MNTILNQLKNVYSICKFNSVLKDQINPSGRNIRPSIPIRNVVNFDVSNSIFTFLYHKFFREVF